MDLMYFQKTNLLNYWEDYLVPTNNYCTLLIYEDYDKKYVHLVQPLSNPNVHNLSKLPT